MATPSSSSSPRPSPAPHSIANLLNTADRCLTRLASEHKGREYSVASIDANLTDLNVVRANLQEVKTVAFAAPVVPLRGRLCRRVDKSISESSKRTDSLASGLHAAELRLSQELITKADELFNQAQIKEAVILYSKALEANPHLDEFSQYKIKMIKEFSPQLELLADLLNQGRSETNVMRVINFASAVAFEAVFDESPSAPIQQFFPCTNNNVAVKRIETTKNFLAKIIFLVEKKPEFFADMFFRLKELKFLPFFNEGVVKCTSIQNATLVKKIREVFESIEGQFEKLTDRIKDEITSHRNAHARARIHDPEVAVAVRIPILIAQIILTKSGQINKELIPELLKKLVDPATPHKHYEKGLVETLHLVATSPEIQEELMNIKAPFNQTSDEAEVVRTALHMDIDKLVCDADARVVALSGILSHWRQAMNVGSCFVTSFAIGALRAHQAQCLRDFGHLMYSGIIRRTIKGEEYTFPYLLKTPQESLAFDISLDVNGMTYVGKRTTCHAWQILPISKACQGMGITNVKSAILAVLKASVFKENEEGVHTLITTPLKLLCDIATLHISEELRAEALKRALFRYGAEVESPMLRVWENSLAGMALITDHPTHISQLFGGGSISKVIETRLQSLLKPGDDFEGLELVLVKKFLKEVQAIFDPAILSNDHYSSGFILYDRHGSLNFKDWTTIDSAEVFHQVIIRGMEGAIDSSLTTLDQQEYPRAFEVAKSVVMSIKTPQFIQDVMAVPEAKINEVKRAYRNVPWIRNTEGGWHKILHDVYWNSMLTLESDLELTPAHPSIQIKNIVTICLNYRLKFNQIPNLRILVHSSGHSFNLLPMHPSLFDKWEVQDTPDSWLQHRVIVPGKEIANSILTIEQTVNFLHNVEENIIKECDREKFGEQGILLPLGLSIAEFRHEIVKIIKTFHYSDEKRLITRVDNLIVEEILYASQKKKLEDTIIGFADTNWATGVHDKYHAFCINPGTRELEFVEISGDAKFFGFEPESWWSTEKIIMLLPQSQQVI